MMGCSIKLYSMGHSRKKIYQLTYLIYQHLSISVVWNGKKLLLENIGTILVVFRNPSRKKGGYLLIHHRKQRPYHRNKDLSLLCWIHHRILILPSQCHQHQNKDFYHRNDAFLTKMTLSSPNWWNCHQNWSTLSSKFLLEMLLEFPWFFLKEMIR